MDLCAVPCERGARWSQAPLSAGPKRNGEDAHRAAANPAGAPAILAATPSAEALVAISGVERLQGINLNDRRVDLPVPEGRRGLGWLRTAEQSRRDLDEGASDRTEDGPKSRGADWRRASEAAGFSIHVKSPAGAPPASRCRVRLPLWATCWRPRRYRRRGASAGERSSWDAACSTSWTRSGPACSRAKLPKRRSASVGAAPDGGGRRPELDAVLDEIELRAAVELAMRQQG